MIKNVKLIFLFLLVSSLVSLSFIEKNRLNEGLKVGDKAPSFSIGNENRSVELNELNGNYVLISFWASYDAESRTQNAILNNVASKIRGLQVVSVSFDEYKSIFNETIKKDQLMDVNCFIDLKGESSKLFKTYQLNKGFTNYLLDKNGIIVAKNINSNQLFSLIN